MLYICSFCLKKTTNLEFKCDKISNFSFQYCSEKCMNEDKEHINYHNNISNYNFTLRIKKNNNKLFIKYK